MARSAIEGWANGWCVLKSWPESRQWRFVREWLWFVWPPRGARTCLKRGWPRILRERMSLIVEGFV